MYRKARLRGFSTQPREVVGDVDVADRRLGAAVAAGVDGDDSDRVAPAGGDRPGALGADADPIGLDAAIVRRRAGEPARRGSGLVGLTAGELPGDLAAVVAHRRREIFDGEADVPVVRRPHAVEIRRTGDDFWGHRVGAV